VIAGHGNDRRRKPIEKFARGGEFGAARALREIAADGDEIRFLRLQIGEQPRGDDGVVAAEMQIRNMGNFPLYPLDRGTKTRRAPGRTRYVSGVVRMATSPSRETGRRWCRERMVSVRRRWCSKSRA